MRVGPPPGTVMGTAAESMSQPGWDHTIFAPIDAAFTALDDATLETLFEPEGATQLVRIHVVPRIIPSTDLETGELLTVGGPIPVTIDGSGIGYGEARVVETDIEASNGIIHAIDAVVLP
ncbi:MAG: fasciclin domain-containing protein [Actinomycetota bacterium]